MRKNIFIKKVLTASIISLLFMQMFYTLVFEPTVVTALTTDTVVVSLNVDAGVAISDGLAATMSPNIGITQNKSIGSSSWNVTSNSATGYTLVVHANASPALVKPAGPGAADSFNDYTPAATIPDTWGGVASSDKEFGFSARGTDSLASFGGATTCGNTGTGVPDTSSKFLGFNNTTDIQIATRSTITTPSGVPTYICFAAEQGSAIYATAGQYQTTITATVATI